MVVGTPSWKVECLPFRHAPDFGVRPMFGPRSRAGNQGPRSGAVVRRAKSHLIGSLGRSEQESIGNLDLGFGTFLVSGHWGNGNDRIEDIALNIG